jgi:hypothetical protein
MVVHEEVLHHVGFTIPGKQSVTTENFDVYMEPLLEELLELWEGVLAYDVLKDMGSREFRLRGMLLWTIHGMAPLVALHIKDMWVARTAVRNWVLNTPPNWGSKFMLAQGGGWIKTILIVRRP